MPAVLSKCSRSEGHGDFATPTWAKNADWSNAEHIKKAEMMVSKMFHKDMVVSAIDGTRLSFTEARVMGPHTKKKTNKLLQMEKWTLSMATAHRLGAEKRNRFEGKHRCCLCHVERVDGNMKKCSQCRAQRYCSRDCQEKDWPDHRTNCISAIKIKGGRGAKLND